MEPQGHANRVVGLSADALPEPSAGRFEVRAALDGASLGTWPRSDVDELNAALAALDDGRDALEAMAPDARREVCERALSVLTDDGGLARWLAARLGLEDAELARHMDVGGAVRSGLDATAEDRLGGRVALVMPDWSLLLAGTAVAVLGELLAGRSVLVFPDTRTPAIVDALAVALEGAGLPPGCLATLHGADATLVRAAARTERVQRALVTGPEERIRAVQAAAAARAPGAPLAIGSAVPRGMTLDLGSDAPERAAELVRRSFGRAESLSGQLPGRVEIARCDPRSFSRLTEALLAELASSPDAANPVPLIDGDALGVLQETVGTGLDEGATLIHGDVPRGKRAPAPVVFTNVEPWMQLFERTAPVPVLRLVRAES